MRDAVQKGTKRGYEATSDTTLYSWTCPNLSKIENHGQKIHHGNRRTVKLSVPGNDVVPFVKAKKISFVGKLDAKKRGINGHGIVAKTSSAKKHLGLVIQVKYCTCRFPSSTA